MNVRHGIVLALIAVAAVVRAQAPPAAPAIVKEIVKDQELPIELDEHRKPALVTKGNCFFKGGTLLTATHGVVLNGDILVRNGKIVAIGKNLTPPEGMLVIDATGKFVTPGLIDAHSHIASDSTNEATDSITAEVRIQDVLDPQSLSLYRGLSSGVTASLILHGSANAIGGQSSVIKMKWGHPVDELLVSDAPRMIKFALGENVKRSYMSSLQIEPRFPTTRMGVEAVYRRAFGEARNYMAAWDRYDRERQADPRVVPPRRDLRLETLADILRGKIWVHCHCYRADEMLMMLRLSKEFGFKIGALQHALEAYKIMPEILASGTGISTFSDAWAYKTEAFEAIPYNAAMCLRAGIVTSVNSDNGAGTYRLNLEAARCMHYGGLSEEEALRLITINPALQLGIAQRTGSLEAGKDADIALWEGDPFSVYSKCILTLIEGEVYFQRRDAFGVDKTAVIKNRLDLCPTDHLALPSLPERRDYALVGATVHPILGPDIPNGTVLIEDGRIKAVGSKITLPKGACIVNVRGLHVYPGLIDAGSQLGLIEVQSDRATIDFNEGGEFEPDLLALTAVNPASEHLAITRFDGVTTALTAPSDGSIAGQSALINLAGWTPEEMKAKSPVSLHVSFPEPRLGRFDFGRPPSAVEAGAPNSDEIRTRKLRDYFEKAKRYATLRTQEPDRLPFDPRLEAMMPYVTGQRPVVFSVTTARGIRNAVQFAEEMGLKAVISDGGEAWMVADLLAKKKIPVVYTMPINNSLGFRAPSHDYDPYDTVVAAPAVLQRAGVMLCFQSHSASAAKNLPRQVGIACAYGLPHEAALKALTIQAAEVLGIADSMGSLTPGKIANVIVTDGDPLEITTSLHHLFIAGKPIALESKHTHLYQKYGQRMPPTKGISVQPAAARAGGASAGG